ncbi:MAG: hypothetical protein ACKO2P_15000, partial [Planctomycetota bacterium]
MTLLLTASADKADQTAEPLLLSLCGSRDHSWQLCSEGEYSCGSSLQDDIRLNISGIAAGHCRLIYRGGQLHVRRGLGRIWVHELPVAGETRICEGDVVSLGGIALRFDGVVTAWIRSGRRIDLNPSAESLEAATPVVQFIGNSGVPFSRLASLFASQSSSADVSPPSLNAATAAQSAHVTQLAAEAEASLKRREQELRNSETAISRILDELEQTRRKQQQVRQQLEQQSAENRLTADILQKKHSELNAEFAASRTATELHREELNQLQSQLLDRERELSALQQQLATRQHEYELGQTQLNAALSDLALRQSEHQTTEQQLLLRRKQLDSREQELMALQQQ